MQSGVMPMCLLNGGALRECGRNECPAPGRQETQCADR
jgi:hypothetical protein